MTLVMGFMTLIFSLCEARSVTMYKQRRVKRLGEDWNTSVEEVTCKLVYNQAHKSFVPGCRLLV